MQDNLQSSALGSFFGSWLLYDDQRNNSSASTALYRDFAVFHNGYQLAAVATDFSVVRAIQFSHGLYHSPLASVKTCRILALRL